MSCKYMYYYEYEDIKTIKNFNEIINKYNETHFHCICNVSYNKFKIIKHCIKYGADLNFKNYYGTTPFSVLCYYIITKKVLEYCLKNGADLNIKNVSDETPFDLICEYNKDLIKYCKPYMNEYDFVKILKENNINWKEYV